MTARKTITVFIIILFLGISICLMAAGDPFSGVWKLNLSKSNLPPPVSKSQTVWLDVSGGGIRVREEIVSDKGEKMVVSGKAKFDGKDYPVKGSPFADAVAYQRVDSHTIKGIAKKAGKVVSHETAIVSKDGKVMTTTYSATDAAGKSVTAVAVFDKQ